jgi:hypothetical protein
MADRLDRGSASEVSFDLLCDAVLFTCGVDFVTCTRRRIVAAISSVGNDAFDGVTNRFPAAGILSRNSSAVRIRYAPVRGFELQ